MPTATHIFRTRRRIRERRAARSSGAIVACIIAATLLIGLLILISALLFADLSAGLPPLESIELAFGPAGEEGFQPTRIFDRSGEIVLLEVLHPAASERRWVHLSPAYEDVVPQHVIDATLAAVDTTFLSNPGYDPQSVFQAFLDKFFRRSSAEYHETIAQDLIEAQLLPFEDHQRTAADRYLRSALLAAGISQRYTKDQILEWYLNSAAYGHLTYGIDAAALVYFGKHARDLTLAESAMLAAVAVNPEINPVDTPIEARKNQRQVLVTMLEMGVIGRSGYERGLSRRLSLESVADDLSSPAVDFTLFVLDRLKEIAGLNAANRSGLRVISTLDYDLHLQSKCAYETHAQRLKGAEVGVVQPAHDGTACIAAGLLPTLRPGDVGFDHNLSDVAVVILDPTSGEILSLHGPALSPRSTGSAFTPFIYLTAFSQGYSPATMVLDVPLEDASILGGLDITLENDDGIFHGPVRIRTALANSYNAAAARNLSLVGVENVLRIATSMGIDSLNVSTVDYEAAMALGMVEANLLDMTYAYSVMANQGRMSGVSSAASGGPGSRSLDPVAILRVEDREGRSMYNAEFEERPVLSPQLAFLMTDVMSDESARWGSFGQSNSLEIGKPAGVKTGVSSANQINWTVGFTPSQAVGVWVGSAEDEEMQGVNALNGATPIWHAIIRYATRDASQAGWVLPLGMQYLEVCDPSGLLPTEYCPLVVREVFMNGGEPTSYDNLYKPFLVNIETEKLATLLTPLEVVEERVYMIPPPGAAVWAVEVGIEQPPREYDTLYEVPIADAQVNILSPTPFERLRGETTVVGTANPDQFATYRLQYGHGLNPVDWFQIGGERTIPVEQGRLGVWDTAGLNGLYTLRLLVVDEEGRIGSAAVHVTIDNQPPHLEILSPQPGHVLKMADSREIIIEAEVRDEMGVESVAFFVNGEAVESVSLPPYSIRWEYGGVGTYTIFVRAYDAAGNETESEEIVVQVVR
jgi:membrane peptidoglycan carboxypeptidase